MEILSLNGPEAEISSSAQAIKYVSAHAPAQLLLNFAIFSPGRNKTRDLLSVVRTTHPPSSRAAELDGRTQKGKASAAVCLPVRHRRRTVRQICRR